MTERRSGKKMMMMMMKIDLFGREFERVLDRGLFLSPFLESDKKVQTAFSSWKHGLSPSFCRGDVVAVRR